MSKITFTKSPVISGSLAVSIYFYLDLFRSIFCICLYIDAYASIAISYRYLSLGLYPHIDSCRTPPSLLAVRFIQSVWKHSARGGT